MQVTSISPSKYATGSGKGLKDVQAYLREMTRKIKRDLKKELFKLQEREKSDVIKMEHSSKLDAVNDRVMEPPINKQIGAIKKMIAERMAEY